MEHLVDIKDFHSIFTNTATLSHNIYTIIL